MITITNAVLFARASLALIFIWFGAMNFTSVGVANMASWIGGHPFLSGLEPQAASAAITIGIYQIIMGALIGAPLPSGSFRRIGFIMLGAHAACALTVLFTNPVWIESAGGFPAIGSGQGILKYLGILGLAMWAGSFDQSRMFSHRQNDWRQWSRPVMLAGLILVLGWIGAMKFTAVEARGIEPLVETSLFFAWTLNFVDIQIVSYVIGVIELLTVIALTGYWYNRRLYALGLLASALTFVLTLSFMVSFAPSWSADLGGFPALSGAGHFLIKDLALLAVCGALGAEFREYRYGRRA
ncbi:MAG: DUF417 family protein [Alphaproteobacteria bacterium]|nr:DUF417 family protein [Alphaproteobacteria bacterium]